MVAHRGRKMKDLFSPDSNWHDLGEVKYELLFPGRLLLQFLQQDDFPKALGMLECVTYLLLPEQWVEQNRLTTPFWGSQVLMEMGAVPWQRVSLQVQTSWDIADVTEFASTPGKEREMPMCFLSLQRCVLDLRSPLFTSLLLLFFPKPGKLRVRFHVAPSSWWRAVPKTKTDSCCM